MVIDDIDTLTTAGIEAGIDFLYGVLWRSRKRSKILYTLRNRPTHSIGSSIEVTGLDGDEYDQFLAVCAQQFNVQLPSLDFAQGQLKRISEGRPLVVESIVALRRSSGSYDAALGLFEKGSGEDVRSYVFRREWDALDANDRGRELLAIMAINGDPLAFDDLVVISQLEQSRVKDAISSIQEMFLLTEDNGSESIYSLGDLTRSFVISVSSELDLIDTIKARVKHYKSSHYPDRPELKRLQVKLERARAEMRYGDLDRMNALALEMSSGRYEPAVLEDPRFLALRGYVQILLPNGNKLDAREDLRRALSFKFSPNEEYIRAWFEFERESDTGDERTKEISDAVEESKGYSQEFKAEIKFWRASCLYNMGRRYYYLEPEKSIDRLFESLETHLLCYKTFIKIESYRIQRSEEYSKNTAYFLIQKLIDIKEHVRMIKFIQDISKKSYIFDALVEPIPYMFQLAIRISREKSEYQRLDGHLNTIMKISSNNELWFDKNRKNELLDSLQNISERNKKNIREK